MDDDDSLWSMQSSFSKDDVSSKSETIEKLIYRSPRCTTEDGELFPVAPSRYESSIKRWAAISQQAGPHQQDGSVLTLSSRMTPEALRLGMTKHVASRVLSLNLSLNHKKDILPNWLDVIAILFVNLKHITIAEDITPDDDEVAVSSRMRRLYILYRLPYLKSIDETPVTTEERKIARPDDPNGEPIDRDDWLGNDSLLDVEEEDEEADTEIGAPSIVASASEELDELVARISGEDPEDALAGECLVEEFQVSSSGPGEQREDKSSSNPSSLVNRESDVRVKIEEKSLKTHNDIESVEVDLCGAVRSILQRERPRIQIEVNTDPLTNIVSTGDNVEFVSIASTPHPQDWTEACGVLGFRGDRVCAPSLQFAFGGNERKSLVGEDDMSVRNKAKKALRENYKKQNTPPPIKTPQAICDACVCKGPLKFFSDAAAEVENRSQQSANEKCSPSKSLSSPFPLQFRERLMTSNVPILGESNGVVDTITSNSSMKYPEKSSKKTKFAIKKNERPPPCPERPWRKGAIASPRSPLLSKKSRMRRRVKLSKKSVFDDDDDDDSTEENLDEDVVFYSDTSESNEMSNDQ